MKKPRVLILQESIVSYRIPIYNLISKKCKLTVAYTDKNQMPETQNFEVKKLNKKKISFFYIIEGNFKAYCNKFDVVIMMSDLHYFSYIFLPFLKRNFKIIPWTIGIRSSYKRRFNIDRKKNFIDLIFMKILQKSDAIIFYSKEPILFWGNLIEKKKIFIANNTVEICKKYSYNINSKKNSILFVGTLYKEKKIFELINAFIESKPLFPKNSDLKLHIIGDGPEFKNIKKIININSLENTIFLHGSIYDENILSNYFKNALLCISPDQAGLSVLKSMGYGVPFVTRFNAITGGERFNILNKINGLFYRDKNELKEIIVKASISPKIFVKMGYNARQHYLTKANPNNMSNEVLNAITFSLKS